MSDFGGLILDGLPEMRAMAESRMTSTATIRRKTGRMVQDDVSGREVPEWEVVYNGPFRLSGATRGPSLSRTVTVGSVEITLGMRIGNLPFCTTGLRDADLIEVTDGDSVGTIWQIVDADPADQQTARRLPLIEAQRPSEWS